MFNVISEKSILDKNYCSQTFQSPMPMSRTLVPSCVPGDTIKYKAFCTQPCRWPRNCAPTTDMSCGRRINYTSVNLLLVHRMHRHDLHSVCPGSKSAVINHRHYKMVQKRVGQKANPLLIPKARNQSQISQKSNHFYR